jgi:hypothetical protein
LNNGVLQTLILQLYALDEDAAELGHVVELRLETVKA